MGSSDMRPPPHPRQLDKRPPPQRRQSSTRHHGSTAESETSHSRPSYPQDSASDVDTVRLGADACPPTAATDCDAPRCSVPEISFTPDETDEGGCGWQFALMRHNAHHTVALCRQLAPGAPETVCTARNGEAALRSSLSMWMTIPLVDSTELTDFEVLACS